MEDKLMKLPINKKGICIEHTREVIIIYLFSR